MKTPRYRSTNRFKVVDPKEWLTWTRQARAAFNHAYDVAKDQTLFRHPLLTGVKPAFWHHTRLQIAYLAAQTVMKTEKLSTMRLDDYPPYWRRRLKNGHAGTPTPAD